MRWLECLLRVLPVWLAAAWAMSLSTLGLFVVPMLFSNLPSPALAGTIAGHLFSVQTGISVACALGSLLLLRARPAGVTDHGAHSALLLAGALLALLVEFGAAPHIRAHDDLALWHGLATGMYFVQWLCALVVFGRYAKRCASAAEMAVNTGGGAQAP